MARTNEAGSPRWPDFIGLGTVKSGTTWMYRCLDDHPDTWLPTMKEIQYFDENYALGPDWYRRLFAAAGSRVTGEITPRYITRKETLSRLRDVPQHVKFLVSFRNPVDRAYSHFQMDMREATGISESQKVELFETATQDLESEYFRFGLYGEQVSLFVEEFGIDRFHFVLFDDIAACPEKVLAGMYAFLGLNDDFLPESIRTRANESKRYKSVRLFRFMRKLVRIGEAAGLTRLILWLKVTGVRDKVIGLMERSENYRPMHAATRARLAELYAPSIRQLADIIDKDLSAWQRAPI